MVVSSDGVESAGDDLIVLDDAELLSFLFKSFNSSPFVNEVFAPIFTEYFGIGFSVLRVWTSGFEALMTVDLSRSALPWQIESFGSSPTATGRISGFGWSADVKSPKFGRGPSKLSLP